MIAMNKLMISAIAAAGLSACSQSASSDNQAAQTAATEEVVQDDMTNMAMNDTADPYSPAMMKMNQAMMSAEGANASETWGRKMIPHHQGAIDMSNALLEQGGDEKFLAKARKTSADMQKEIASLDALTGIGGEIAETGEGLHMVSRNIRAAESTNVESFESPTWR